MPRAVPCFTLGYADKVLGSFGVCLEFFDGGWSTLGFDLGEQMNHAIA